MARDDDRLRGDVAGIGPDPSMANRLHRLSESHHYRVASGEPDIRGWEVRTLTGTHLGQVEDLRGSISHEAPPSGQARGRPATGARSSARMSPGLAPGTLAPVGSGRAACCASPPDLGDDGERRLIHHG